MTALFDRFRSYLNEMSLYRLAAARVYWDMETFHTPKNAVGRHIEAYTFLNMKLYAMSTDPAYGDMLRALKEDGEYALLSEGWKLTVDRRLKDLEDIEKVPKELYEREIRDRAAAGRIWAQAKRDGDYAAFAPMLEKVIRNAKERAACLDPGKDPYDLYLEEHEEGMDRAKIDALFGELRDGLKSLTAAIAEKPEPDSRLFRRRYSIQHQKEAARFLLEYIGYDMDSGDLAEAEHPVTMGTGRTDVRVTDHYFEDDGISPLLSILHEGGHGIAGQSVAEELAGTDAESNRHTGLAESQSRFYENILGRSRGFWEPIYGEIARIMPELGDIPPDAFHRRINTVKCGPLRMRADEVTYCLHIILRYEMEKRIFAGDVNVNELPGMWNDMSQELLGLRPKDDREGILQDMHWSSSYWGYFPGYLLGSIYDGMFLEKLEEDMGSAEDALAAGRIKDITQWFRDNVLRFGGLYPSGVLIKRLCGKEISAKPLLDHFRRKYTAIYGL